MRTAITPVLAVFVAVSCGFLAAGQDQGSQQAPAKKEAQAPKGASGLTDPAAMAGAQPTPKSVPPGGVPADKSYVFGAEDILQIWVVEQPNISGQFTVRPDGMISVPMVGEVQAGGESNLQLEAAIAERLKANEIIKEPSVTVALLASHSRKYYISGQVNKPGQFDLVVPTRVSAALANAGGFKDFAKTKSIRIIREGHVLKYNDKEVSHGKKMDQNILLQPGDHIYVD